MREGDYKYPKTCFEIMARGSSEKVPYPSGIYKIEPKAGKIVQTYCDFDRHAGGWTLVTKSSSASGWTKEKVMEFNSDNVANNDFSIFGLVDHIKHLDDGEVS